MNRDEAKNILIRHRPGTADAEDPQVAEALTLAKADAELAQWLEEHSQRQSALRAKFQSITVPEGLKEQIISEQRAADRRRVLRQRTALVTSAVLAMVVLLLMLWPSGRPTDDTFAIYRSRMISGALRGYAMDLETNNPAAIRNYLARKNAPADYVLPAALQHLEMTGCAVQRWQGTKVAMLCFRTGRPMPPGQGSDLWLFIVDRSSVKESPDAGLALAKLAPVHRLMTATWTEGGMLYLLGTPGDGQTIRQFL